MLSIRRAVELTHLHVLRLLMSREWTGRYECALKGGANLRFFYGSPRLSEDMDFDVFISNDTMNRRIKGILANKYLHKSLSQSGVRIAEISHAKDTEVAGKWKIQLAVEHHGMVVPTKMDLSWREPYPDSVPNEQVDREIAAFYGMPAFGSFHYDGARALAQKINALASRSVTQARDVFDMFWLMTTKNFKLPLIGNNDLLKAAIDSAYSLDYDTYVAHVGPYMEEETHAIFVNRATWDDMVKTVVGQMMEQV